MTATVTEPAVDVAPPRPAPRFGFTESTHAPLFDQALAVETAGVVWGGLLTAISFGPHRPRLRRQR